MPIKKLGSTDRKPNAPERQSRNYSEKTAFAVVGIEAGRRLIHTVPLIEGKEELAGQTVIIDGKVTAKELRDIGVNIDNWLDKGLITLYNKSQPWEPMLDEMDIPKSNARVANSE